MSLRPVRISLAIVPYRSPDSPTSDDIKTPVPNFPTSRRFHYSLNMSITYRLQSRIARPIRVQIRSPNGNDNTSSGTSSMKSALLSITTKKISLGSRPV